MDTNVLLQLVVRAARPSSKRGESWGRRKVERVGRRKRKAGGHSETEIK